MGTPMIRPAIPADLEAINAIHNHYIATSTCTYVDEPITPAERSRWFEEHGPKHPIMVVQVDGQVVGWGSLSRFHPRPGYRHTVEDSIYIRQDMHRRGLGRTLLVDLIAQARSLGHHSILALISAEQSGSIRLHETHGFVEAGRLRQVGFKFNQWLDVVYMQLML